MHYLDLQNTQRMKELTESQAILINLVKMTWNISQCQWISNDFLIISLTNSGIFVIVQQTLKKWKD